MQMNEPESVVGLHYRTGERIAVLMNEGLISEIKALPQSDGAEHDPETGADAGAGAGAELPWIAPGLVDLQVNGFGGFDLNTSPLSETTVARLTEALWSEGVTSYYATVITNSSEAIVQAVSTIARACSGSAELSATIAGIHLEGPFISPEDGARGAHDRAFVRPPDWTLFERWQEAAEGRIAIVTLSPEWEGAPTFIARCVESGVTVSIGHTAATPEQIREAAAAGATMSTHLGNGAHPMLPRHPNYLWEQLADDRLWACVIADGFHLPASVLKVALRAKGEKLLLVSDTVYLSGMPPGSYETHIGGSVTLTPEGRLYLTGQPKLLAGSAVPLTGAIASMTASGLCGHAEAWDLASVRPSAGMKLPTAAGLAVGAPADLALYIREDGRIRIKQTYKRGKLVYTSANHLAR